MTPFEELICACDAAGALPDAERLAAAMAEAGITVVSVTRLQRLHHTRGCGVEARD